MKTTSRNAVIASLLALAGTLSAGAATKSIQLYATMDTNGYYTESQIVGGGGSIGFDYGVNHADSLFTFDNAHFSTDPNEGGSYIYEEGELAGTAIKVFPNDENFNWGTISYDDSTVTPTGTSYATITSDNLDVSDSIDQGFTGTGLAEVFFDSECPITFSGVSGTITFVNGVVSSVSLTATVHFEVTVDVPYPYSLIFPDTFAEYTGSFTIVNNAVQFSMNSTDYDLFYYPLLSSTFVWDLPGTLYPEDL